MPQATAILASILSVSPFHNLTAGSLVDRLASQAGPRNDYSKVRSWHKSEVSDPSREVS